MFEEYVTHYNLPSQQSSGFQTPMLKTCIRTTTRAALVITPTDGPAGLKVARRWFDKVHADTFLAQTAIALDSAMSTGGWVALKVVAQPYCPNQIPEHRVPPHAH